jgi:nitric oxide reductase activation protein
VREVDPPESGAAPLVEPDVDHLRRALARIGLEFERCRRQPQGDEIDVDAAVEARVDLRAGCTPNEDVYLAALRRRRDLSALVLLDVSGSAGEPGVHGTPVHEAQRATAAALTRVLYELGDRVALYGFRSHGRSAVRLVRVKRFDEVLGDAASRRLRALTPGAYTRLGAAIRHGTAVLEHEAGTARRLLIVISDGLAYDHGYERAYGEADSRRALTEARNLGIGCVCLSVGARTDTAALRRVFGTAAHAAIDDQRELPPIIGRLFTYALSAASRQRATSRRRVRSAERLRLERTAS